MAKRRWQALKGVAAMAVAEAAVTAGDGRGRGRGDGRGRGRGDGRGRVRGDDSGRVCGDDCGRVDGLGRDSGRNEDKRKQKRAGGDIE